MQPKTKAEAAAEVRGHLHKSHYVTDSTAVNYAMRNGNVPKRGIEQMQLDIQLRHEGVVARYAQAFARIARELEPALVLIGNNIRERLRANDEEISAIVARLEEARLVEMEDKDIRQVHREAYSIRAPHTKTCSVQVVRATYTTQLPAPAAAAASGGGQL
jgi:hypothetical protein